MQTKIKKISILFIFLLFFILLIGCKEEYTRNLPLFTENDTKDTIEEELKKREINYYFNYIQTDDSTMDSKFNSYGENLTPGTYIEEGRLILINLYRYVKRELMISKYFQSTSNKAIELYNFTSNDVDLSNYRLGVYLDGAKSSKIKIKLEGILKPQETFTIVDNSSTTDLKNAADLLVDNLTITGNDAVAILDKNISIVDVVGIVGNGMDHISSVGLLRKSDDNASETFNINNWVKYYYGYTNLIIDNTYPMEIPTKFYLKEEYKNIPFSEKTGTVKVKFISNNDGDTAEFESIDPDQNISFTGENRVRFMGIDTREMSSDNPTDKKLAQDAQKYVYNKLKNAKEIYIQHDVNGNIDNYDRYLGFIWVDGELLNYLIVKEGHSQNNYSTNYFVYENITLDNWFAMAEYEAKTLHKGIWNESN